MTVSLTCGDNNKKVTLADMKLIGETGNCLGLEGHRITKMTCTAAPGDGHYEFHFHYFREKALIMALKPIGAAEGQSSDAQDAGVDLSAPSVGGEGESGQSVSPGP